MFFDPDGYRLYYTLDDDDSLYWRWFTPESSLVGATAFEATGDIGALDPDRVQGMVLADGWLYFADETSGNLLRVGFDFGVVDGPATTVNTTTDWRARALVLSSNQPPVAAATAECTFRNCDFDGSTSSDPDGTIVSWDWDFGDGNQATGATPSHAYADPGEYTVTLEVTDNEGLTATTTIDVEATNAPPIAAFTVTCENQTCDFDGTGSSDPDGTIVSWDWDFGDGNNAAGSTVSHTYDDGGTYTVTLSVTDNDAGVGDLADDVNVQPALEVHLHDLTPNPYDLEGDKWVARVIVKVRDSNGDFAEGVDITASFGGGKIRTCTTNEFGKCKVKIKVADTRPKMPVDIIGVEWIGGYDPEANRDTDGDGDSEHTLIWRPF